MWKINNNKPLIFSFILSVHVHVEELKLNKLNKLINELLKMIQL